jgi:DNA-binding PadR family transcriptional regulator
VYPVLERLEQRGLVEATHAPRGERDGWTYAITGAGKRRFRAWLEPPFAEEIVSVPPDPLRTRLSFLGVLSKERRGRFSARAVEALERELALLEARVEEDPDEQRAHSAAVQAMRARLGWFARGRRSGNPRTR